MRIREVVVACLKLAYVPSISSGTVENCVYIYIYIYIYVMALLSGSGSL